uniref:ABC transporter ATP-binding protein n=1 Tax=Roseihalotalea indica TaxID=2867963 RepID=A0AA49GQM9_9BACT|nr:ABC transporter ATP-binding protein [Tunicatimonas sp. TK19036]
MNILETNHISFAFGKTPVIDEVSLSVPEGAAYGFLGENGTGKSTTLKLLMGLLAPKQGEVRAFGQPMHRHAYKLHQRMGALIEDPPLYPHLSGWENLEVTARYRNLPTKRIDEVLDLVRLRPNAHRKVRGYSTGMKQRLGIALALLSDPDILILDEPTNGLDPQGIIDIRQLIQQLHRQEGKTIVMSSHLLHEVESICTHVGILHQKKLIFQGAVDALKATQRTNELTMHLEVEAPEKALQTLLPFYPAQRIAETVSVQLTNREQVSPMIDLLRQANIAIYAVTPAEVRLEDLYLQLTHEQLPA